MNLATRATVADDIEATLALDAMGGDHGPSVVVTAARRVVQRFRNVRLLLVGDRATLAPLLAGDAPRIEIRHASETVTMEESAADAVRRKKDSSMRVSIDCVGAGEAAACVSAGNTGALMATAKFVLKTAPGIRRPAIMAELPTRQGRIHLLDVGANASCDAEQLFQFAVMGSVVTARLLGMPRPRVALLNIGSEQQKGDERIRDAAALIQHSELNYIGFVEGDDLGTGVADVVVTDGFTGNVALKTMEGTASLVAHFLRASFNAGWWSRLQGFVAWPALRRLAGTLDPRAYNGASFVGLNGIVIKSHGGADAVAFEHAIETALLEVRDNVPAEIRRWLASEAA